MKPVAGTRIDDHWSIRHRAPASLIVISLILASIYAWKRPYTMDESFSMLEAIGQIPFGHDWATRSSITTQEIWAHNDLASVRNAIVEGDNGNMAGFVIALRGMIQAFGTGSPMALAAVSIAGFVLTVYGTFRVGRRLFGERVGLVAAILCLCHFGVIMFGLMLRGNSWAMAAGLFATEAYLKITGLKQGGSDPAESAAGPFRRHIAAYAGWSIIGLFAHFLCALILVVHVAFSLMKLRCRRTWARLAVAGIIVIAVVMPVWRFALSSDGYGDVAAYVTWREQERGHLSEVPQRSPREIVRALALAAQFMGGPYTDFIPLIAFPASLAIMSLAAPARRRIFLNEGAPLALAAMLAAVAFVASASRLMVADSLFPMRPRYMLVSVPYFLILVALAFERFEVFDDGRLFGRPAKLIATAYAILALSVPVILLYGSIAIQKGDPHLLAARQISRLSETGQPIRVSVPTLMDAQLMAFHLGPDHNATFEIEDQAILAEVVDSIRRIGIDHAVVVYYEFWDRYKAQRLDYRRPEMVSHADGIIRYRYRAISKDASR
ncbi:hypothetical protein GC170_00060 [bacterium]|nr:hypothetical protein [bacterium]